MNKNLCRERTGRTMRVNRFLFAFLFSVLLISFVSAFSFSDFFNSMQTGALDSSAFVSCDSDSDCDSQHYCASFNYCLSKSSIDIDLPDTAGEDSDYCIGDYCASDFVEEVSGELGDWCWTNSDCDYGLVCSSNRCLIPQDIPIEEDLLVAYCIDFPDAGGKCCELYPDRDACESVSDKILNFLSGLKWFAIAILIILGLFVLYPYIKMLMRFF